jgi:GTP pyrophosphokinase
MVSIRGSHFSQPDQTDPNKWIATLGLEAEDQEKLLQNYNKALSLCVDEQDRPFLQLGIEIVEILVTLNMDMDTLNAALIFPLLANNHILTQEQVEKDWGKRIAKLVKYSTDMEGIRALQGQGTSEIAASQVANLRHMLLAMVGDIRAVVIKLAERIWSVSVSAYLHIF